MLNPYGMIGRAMALFKAAGLAVPAYGEAEKRRLLDAWVQRYGRVGDEVFKTYRVLLLMTLNLNLTKKYLQQSKAILI